MGQAKRKSASGTAKLDVMQGAPESYGAKPLRRLRQRTTGTRSAECAAHGSSPHWDEKNTRCMRPDYGQTLRDGGKWQECKTPH